MNQSKNLLFRAFGQFSRLIIAWITEGGIVIRSDACGKVEVRLAGVIHKRQSRNTREMSTTIGQPFDITCLMMYDDLSCVVVSHYFLLHFMSTELCLRNSDLWPLFSHRSKINVFWDFGGRAGWTPLVSATDGPGFSLRWSVRSKIMVSA